MAIMAEAAPNITERKTVVILGGSFAGLHVAHFLLKKAKNVKVIVVSKNSHFYWNLASPLVIAGQLDPDRLLVPIQAALIRYPADKWELVVGVASGVHFAEKRVNVAVRTNNNPDLLRTLSYDQLVIATGARLVYDAVVRAPWKAVSTAEDLRERLRAFAAAVAEARHITICGAGGTGVELAGELGAAYGGSGDKEIHLMCRGNKLGIGDTVALAAARELERLGVKIHYNTCVTGVMFISPLAPQEVQNKQHLVLNNSEDELWQTDLYFPTTGLEPNTEFIPEQYLVEADFDLRPVKVDRFLRVQETTDAWACGDVVSQPRASYRVTKSQANTVARNVLAALDGKKPTPWEKLKWDVFACAIGPDSGVGHINDKYPVPSFLVRRKKSRDLGMRKMKKYIDGSVTEDWIWF
ncbi:hypothetical protein VTJ49DRAFT_6229 [Mycothermus thermophilus]|uniref:FAD/NAD(P)-binding domain-containing protein n=1 Tax=Humicola insolens TaxID=85995 RepID=A0ABR3VJR2_HUMIN